MTALLIALLAASVDLMTPGKPRPPSQPLESEIPVDTYACDPPESELALRFINKKLQNIAARRPTGEFFAYVTTVHGYRAAADAHLQKCEYQEAADDYMTILHDGHAQYSGHYGLGRVYYRLRLHTEAMKEFDATIWMGRNFKPEDASLLYGAREHLIIGDYSKALKYLDALVKGLPNYGAAYAERCFARALQRTDMARAKADCDYALQRSPTDFQVQMSSAFLSYRMGETGKALAMLQSAMTLEPDSTQALFVRGLAKRDSGDHAGGQKDLDAAAARNPFIVQDWAELGVR